MSRLSIRMKILIVFMSLFTVALGASFYWFYQSATKKAMENLQESLILSASTAAKLVDADEVMLVSDSEGDGTEAEYAHLASQLSLVKESNPKVKNIYIMVRSPDAADELLFVVDVETDIEIVGEPYDTGGQSEILDAFNGPIASSTLQEDEYGTWLSGFAPIKNAQGRSVAIVGVDMPAQDVTRTQNQIKTASIVAFLAAYVGVFLAAILLSGAITRSLRKITGAAQALEQGEPFEPDRLKVVERELDELGQLARVFSKMAVQVEAREKKLKQEVTQLRIEIDEAKRAKQVSEIANTDYFRDLQKKAREQRGKPKDE
jgi:flagellar basal body-associated protein FliL